MSENSWENIGQIDNDNYSGYQISINGDGNIVAVGASLYLSSVSSAEDNLEDAQKGRVRVYQKTGNKWTQYGGDILGEAAYDWSGSSISLNSIGNIIAIGAPLNNIIEDKTILWQGEGKGHSAEDTAFQNLKQGIDAPDSGSIKTNGKVIAEQIGAQIFIDGWAMVAPGDPERAVHYAKLAASVSHDGEAIYGAQVVAALESMAFVESDLTKLVEQAKKFIQIIR